MSLVDQLLATRIYISCLIISLFILLFYTGLSNQTQTSTVSAPSPATFEKLFTNYPLTLFCPCSRISIPYERFVTFHPQYHQVCSSKFVDQQWIASMFRVGTSNTYPLDYRLFASSHFQVLALLCHAANRSITDMLKGFAASQMISTQVLSSAAFEIELATHIAQLKLSTIAEMNRLDQLVSLLSNQNHLVSALRTNFLITGIPETNTFGRYSVIYPNHSLLMTDPLSTSTESSGSCFCETNSKCSFQAAFYNQSDVIVPGIALQTSQTPSFIVPGMKVGCTPKDSLFQSTLECLFDDHCLEKLVAFTDASFTPPVLSMTSNLNSKFYPNTTLATIFEGLMIESLQDVSNFDDYFHACAPQSCSFSYEKRFSIGYMLTTLIKLVGGLNVMFGTLSPLFVQFVVRKIQHFFGHPTSNEQTVSSDRHQPGTQIILTLLALIKVLFSSSVGMRERVIALLILARNRILTSTCSRKD